MLKKIFLILFGLLFTAGASFVYAGDKIVSLSTLGDYAPFTMIKSGAKHSIKDELIRPDTDSKVLEGYSWDIVRESFHSMGYTIKLSVFPWARAMMLMESHQSDLLFPTGYRTDRAAKYYYSRENVNVCSFLLYVRKDSTLSWNGLESMSGKRIAHIRGYNYGNEWEKQKDIKKITVDTRKQGFNILLKGNVDAFAGYEIPADQYLKKNNLKKEFKKLPSFDFSAEWVTGMRTNANVIQLLNVYDEGKRKIMNNGVLDKIKKKWNIERFY